MKLLCYLGVLLLVSLISASHIVLTASPKNISPVLTLTLQIRCSLKVGKSYTTTNRFHKPRDVLHVVSIILNKFDNVTGTNKTIASVTSFDPAAAEISHLDETIVTGSTQPSTKGEQGYLEVTWISPSDKNAGKYECQVSALNYAKYPVIFKASQQVTASEPTIADVVQYVETNNKNIAKLKQDINVLKSTIASQKIQHIQTGVQHCAQTSQDAFVAFPVSFNNTPKVLTVLTSLGTNRDRYSDTSVAADVMNVNITGFLYKCQTTTVSFNFNWIAIADLRW